MTDQNLFFRCDDFQFEAIRDESQLRMSLKMEDGRVVIIDFYNELLINFQTEVNRAIQLVPGLAVWKQIDNYGHTQASVPDLFFRCDGFRLEANRDESQLRISMKMEGSQVVVVDFYGELITKFQAEVNHVIQSAPWLATYEQVSSGLAEEGFTFPLDEIYYAFGDESVTSDGVFYGLVLIPEKSIKQAQELIIAQKLQYGVDQNEPLHCRKMFHYHARKKSGFAHLTEEEAIDLCENIFRELAAFQPKYLVGHIPSSISQSALD